MCAPPAIPPFTNISWPEAGRKGTKRSTRANTAEKTFTRCQPATYTKTSSLHDGTVGADRTTPDRTCIKYRLTHPVSSLCHSTDINHVVLLHSTLSSNGATATIPFSGLTERKPLSYLPSQTGCKDGRIPAGTWIRPHLFSERSLHHLRALESRQRRDGREIRSYLFGFLPSTRQSILSPVRRSSTSSKPASARPSFTSSKV